MNQVKALWKRTRVAGCSPFQVLILNWHRMQLAEGRLRQAVPQEREIAIGIAIGRYALVDLVDRGLIPREVLEAGELGEHLPWCMATAYRQCEHSPCGDRGACVLDHQLGGA